MLKDIGIAVLKAKINKKEKLIKNVSIGSPNVSMDVSIGSPNVSIENTDVSIENYKCRFCSKIFKHRQSRHRHELGSCSLIKEPKELSVSTISEDKQSNDIKLLEYIEIIKQEKKDIQKENELIKREKKEMRKEIEKLLDKVGNVTTNNNMLQQT